MLDDSRLEGLHPHHLSSARRADELGDGIKEGLEGREGSKVGPAAVFVGLFVGVDDGLAVG